MNDRKSRFVDIEEKELVWNLLAYYGSRIKIAFSSPSQIWP